MKYIFSLLFALLTSFFAFPQNAKIDSLLLILQKESADSTVIKTYAELGTQFFLISKYDKANSFNNDAIRHAERVLSTSDISKRYRHFVLKVQSEAYNSLGTTHLYTGDYEKSLGYYLKALAIREAMGDKRGISNSYNSIGMVLSERKDLDKALESYLKSVKISEEINDTLLMSSTYNNMGVIYQNKKNFDKGLIYYQKALKLYEELGNKREIATSYNNVGDIYNDKNNYKKAEEYYFKALKIIEEMGDKMVMSVIYNNIGDLYLKQNKTVEAKKMQLLSLAFGKEINAKSSIMYSYSSLARCDSALGDFKGAFEYQKMYTTINGNIFNEESDKRMLEMQTKYDTEKKEHEIELLTKDGVLQKSQVKTQKIIIWSIVIGLLIVVVFTFLILNRLKITREQKRIIELQKVIVEQKNVHITDSINYAKRIQDAILPSHEKLSDYFPHHFIFFRPKEIVSGDFYWYFPIPNNYSLEQEKNNQAPVIADYLGGVLLAVVDCTGHGVPGAFMSMIGNTLLNKIVNEQKIVQPAEILNQLQDGIAEALHQGSRTQDDGMDISICLFNKEKDKIIFAGAHHSVFIVHEGAMQKIKGDPYSIGSQFSKKNVIFTQKEKLLQKNSSVFFSTDGFQDQSGEIDGRKFLSTRLEKLFLDISSLEIKKQEETIIKTFDDWRGQYPQRDDVLVVGIKT